MKILKIEEKKEVQAIDILNFIHRLAEENGSKFNIDLIYDHVENEVFCDRPYSNRDYTIGYYAILFLIEKFCYVDTAHTRPGLNKHWFKVKIRNKQQFIQDLS